MEKENWDDTRLRSLKATNHNLFCDGMTPDGPFGLPLIEAVYSVPETGVIGFDEANLTVSDAKRKKGVHFFLPDQLFSKVWLSPAGYADRLSDFGFIISPCFPILPEMSHAQRIWNTYRSRLLGRFFQQRGGTVVPCVVWNDRATWAYCFDGIEDGGVVAVSTASCGRDERKLRWYREGVEELIRRKHPAAILVYGPPVDADYGTTEIVTLETCWKRDVKRAAKRGYADLDQQRLDNLDIFEQCYWTDGPLGIPQIAPIVHAPEDGLICFNDARGNSPELEHEGIHFFVYDYQFGGLWTNPSAYVDRLAEYDCVLTPDFSLYLELSPAEKIWSTYRSRLIGFYLQSEGLRVIPTVSWNGPETYPYCFAGLPVGGTVAVSTQGCRKDELAMRFFQDGVAELTRRKQPDVYIVYGPEVEADYGDAEVVFVANKGITRARRNAASGPRKGELVAD